MWKKISLRSAVHVIGMSIFTVIALQGPSEARDNRAVEQSLEVSLRHIL